MFLWTSDFEFVSIIILTASLAGILTVFPLYPLATWAAARRTSPRQSLDGSITPSVSFVVAVRNAEHLVAEKIENCLSLVYPPELLEFVSS